MPNPVADDESLGSWFNSNRRPSAEPERGPAESLFKERRVPGQSLQSARAEDTARPARFEQAGTGLNAERADFDEPSRATAQAAPRTPQRFASPPDDFDARPPAERGRAPGTPPVTQAPGFNGDSRGAGTGSRPEFGDETRIDRRGFREDTPAGRPDFREDTPAGRRGFREEAPAGRPDFGDETRIDQRPARFFEDTDPEERTRLNQPRFEPPASPPFGGASGFGADPGFGADRGLSGERGLSARPGGAEWTFLDDGGPETGAFQGAYGGNGGQPPALSEPPGFTDGWGAPRTPGDAGGSFGADELGFAASGPYGQGWQPGKPEAAAKKSRKVPVIIGVGVLIVALGAGGAVAAPKFLKHPDPGCTAYTSNALPAYNHAITDLNAQAAQPTLESDVAAAISQLQTAAGQASSPQVKTALQALLTKLQEVQADVKAGAVPKDTVSSLNTASSAADNAC
jgi:hypothetical protein